MLGLPDSENHELETDSIDPGSETVQPAITSLPPLISEPAIRTVFDAPKLQSDSTLFSSLITTTNGPENKKTLLISKLTPISVNYTHSDSRLNNLTDSSPENEQNKLFKVTNDFRDPSSTLASVFHNDRSNSHSISVPKITRQNEVTPLNLMNPESPIRITTTEHSVLPTHFLDSDSMIHNHHEVSSSGSVDTSTGTPISIRRYVASISKRTTANPLQRSNMRQNRPTVCANDPCGPEVACHPTEVDFVCICSDGTKVAAMSPCPVIKPVNVTPPAISMPQANESVSSPSQQGLLVGVVVSMLMVAVLACLVFWRKKKLKADLLQERTEIKLRKNSVESLMLPTYNFASNPNYYATSPDQLPLQLLSVPLITKEEVTFIGDLGEGCFGRVYKGEYEVKSFQENDVSSDSGRSSYEGDRNCSTDSSEVEMQEQIRDKNQKRKKIVAIKVLKEFVGGEAEADFMREVEIMATFRHKNILALIGVIVSEAGKVPWMVFEYMSYGDLAEVLRSCNKKYSKNYLSMNSFSKLQLLDMCIQVAAGMEYLSLQHFVHRDLACRNCLVGDNLTVKISDFGMSRDVYTCDYYKVGGSRMLPVRWMAPESIMYGKFTLESDVWSFGVLMWEIFSYGKQPYYGNSNEEVVQLILQGILLRPLESCPCLVREVMRLCWSTDACNRLHFQEIYERLCQARKVLGIMEETEKQPLDELNYSQLCSQDSTTKFITDQDEYLVPKNVHVDEYLTIMNN